MYQLKGKRQAKDPAPGLQICSLGALAPGQVEEYIVFWDVELNVNIPKIGLGCDRYLLPEHAKIILDQAICPNLSYDYVTYYA